MISTYNKTSKTTQLPVQLDVEYTRNGTHSFTYTDAKGIPRSVHYSTDQSLADVCVSFCKSRLAPKGTLVLSGYGNSIADKLHAVPVNEMPGEAITPASGKKLELGDYVVELKAERAA
jgi:hypothetical protein